MGQAAKKINQDDIDIALSGAGDEQSQDLKDQVAMELAMLEGLKSTSPPTKSSDDNQNDDGPGASVRAEDLEYPDIPSPSVSAPENVIEEDLSIDDAAVEEIGSLSAKQRFDQSMLRDEVVSNDLDDELDSLETEDDPTSGGFQLEVDELQQAPGVPAANVSVNDNDNTEESTKSRSRQDELRIKRKKQLEEKKRQRLEAEKKAEEERKQREEYDRQNNILSIEELKRQATQSSGDEPDTEEATQQSEETSAQTTVAQPSAINVVAIANELLAKKAVTPGYTPPAQQKVVSVEEGPKAPWYKRLASSVFIIFSELLKIAAPSALLYFYMEHDKSRELSTQALAHMATGDQFQVEVALNLLNENFSTQHNAPYFELVRKKIERQLESVWLEDSSLPEVRGATMRALADYTFNANSLNIPEMVKKGHELAEQAMRERYENLYDAEMKVASQKEVVDNLRQANIFLRQRECLKSFERFEVVLQYISDSMAASKGKILSVNCAFQHNHKDAMTYFKKRGSIEYIRAMNKKAEPPPVAVKETVAPVAPSAPERQPAALKNQNSSKNKKKR